VITREQERAVTCPRCGALAGKPCRTVNGRYRTGTTHAERRAVQGFPTGQALARAHAAERKAAASDHA
jgi:hypothetical protein